MRQKFQIALRARNGRIMKGLNLPSACGGLECHIQQYPFMHSSAGDDSLFSLLLTPRFKLRFYQGDHFTFIAQNAL